MRPTTRRSTQMLMIGDAADEGDDADRAEQRRDDVDEPVRAAGVADQLARSAPLRFERSRMSYQLSVMIVRSARDHRSSSPTLMSMLPSVTMASAIVLPTVISFSDAEVDQRRRAHVPAVRRGAAVADDVEAQLALRRFDARVRLAGRRAHARAARRSCAGPPGRSCTRLADDAQALLHLLDADDHAVVGVAVVADGDIELHAVVDAVRVRLADVPGDARRSRSIGPLSDALIAISGVTTPTSRARIMMISLPTRSWSYSSKRYGQVVVDQLVERRQELVGDVERDAADAHVVRREARAAGHLEQVEHLLAVAEAVHDGRLPGAAVVDEGAGRHAVAGDALQLGEDDAQVLARAPAPRCPRASRPRGSSRGCPSSPRGSPCGR